MKLGNHLNLLKKGQMGNRRSNQICRVKKKSTIAFLFSLRWFISHEMTFYKMDQKLSQFWQNRSNMGQVQVNLFQKLLFLHQLTHNMTKDCSLNYMFSTFRIASSEHAVFVLTFRTIYVHNMFWACSFHVLNL